MNRRVPMIMALATALMGCQPASPPSGQYVGYVEAEWRHLAAPASGWVTTLQVDEGDRISQGDILITLDSEAEVAALNEAKARVEQRLAEARNIETGARSAEILALEARLDEARARLTKAERDRDRILPLVAQGLEPRSTGEQLTADADAAKALVSALSEDIEVASLAGRPEAQSAADAQIRAARSAHAAARYTHAKRTLRAPADGRVERVILREGEFAAAGAPIVSIAPDDARKVRFFLPQSALPGIALGDVIQIHADGQAQHERARISYIASDAEFTPPVIYSKDERQKLVFLVEADLPPETSLKPGLPVDVRL